MNRADKKRVVMACLTAFLSVIIGFGNNFIFARAETAHNFVNGKCACGKFGYEAETGLIKGRTSDSAGVNTDMITDGTYSFMSGGKCVEDFGTVGNSITWAFSVDKAATIGFNFAMVGNGTMTDVKITVNGNVLDWETASLTAFITDGEQAYYNFTEHKTKTVAVAADEKITVKLTNNGGIALNVDYFTIEGLASDAVITTLDPSEPVSPVHTHTFGEVTDKNVAVCSECGAIKLEAETATMTGTPTGGSSFIVVNEKASGGMYIGNWEKGDNILTLTFTSDKAAQATVEIAMIYYSGFTNLPTKTEGGGHDEYDTYDAMLFRVNEKTYGFTVSEVPFTGNAGSVDFGLLQSVTVPIVAGNNSIEIEAVDGTSLAFDYITIKSEEKLDIDNKFIDTNAPIIGDITVSEVKLNSAVNFSFTVTDNKTATEELTVSTKVYFDYGKEGQTEIAVDNKSFVPDKEGVYTIVINAADKDGNASEKKRAIIVEKESDSDSDSGSDGDSDSTDRKTGDTDIGQQLPPSAIAAIILFSSIGALLIITGITFYLRSKKGKSASGSGDGSKR